MNGYEIQQSGYSGHVWAASSECTRPLYFYSVWRTPHRERLFDGAAGDIAEAVSTLRAHIDYLVASGGSSIEE